MQERESFDSAPVLFVHIPVKTFLGKPFLLVLLSETSFHTEQSAPLPRIRIRANAPVVTPAALQIFLKLAYRYPAYAFKLSSKNFAFEDNKKVVPLYAAFCI